jgi:hypothetical protein
MIITHSGNWQPFLQEVVTLLLKHHHTAEPQNTAQQAQQYHEAAKPLWEACEVLQASTAGTSGWPAAAGGAAGDADDAAAGWQLTHTLLDSWSALAQVGFQFRLLAADYVVLWQKQQSWRVFL